MDERYVRRYRQLYESHWWWRAREDLLLRTIPDIAPRGRRLAILDVGCGDGLFFDKLSQFGEVFGVESDPAGISASSPWAERIRVGPFDASFHPGRRFDLILFLDVLEHFDDPGAVLRRALELLVDDGRILVTVPAFRALWTTHDDLNRHVTRYTKASLERVASGAGAAVLEMRYFFGWVAPVKLFQRWVERLTRVAPAPPAIPSPGINQALYRFSRLEQRLVGARSIPFGSSLLAVLGGAPSRATP